MLSEKGEEKGNMIKDDDIRTTDDEIINSPADEVKARGGRYADSYASSESNIADMLAEYDSIGNDDRRPVRRSARPTESCEGVARKKRPAEAKRESEIRRRPSEAKKSSDKHKKPVKAKEAPSKHVDKKVSDKPVKTKHVAATGQAVKRKPVVSDKKNRYADAMYDEIREPKKRIAEPAHKSTSVAPKASAHKGAPTTSKTPYSGTGRSRSAASSGRTVRYAEASAKGSRNTKKRRSGNKFTEWLHGLTGLDYMVGATGVAVLVVAIVLVNVFGNVKAVDDKVSEFVAIGNELSGIGTAGEGVLYATANSRDIELPDEQDEDFELTEYNEKEDEESGNVTVSMSLQSVVKDLKIKFINKKSGKLIAGIPFKAEVTDANGKTQTYTDDDKDGVIYISKIQHGEAKVKLVELDGYDKYTFETGDQKVTVKETPDYKKIDVSNEVKKESQVNVAKEDFNQDMQVEGALKDTVEWVESTKTPNGTTTKYTAVSAGDIAKPAAISGVDWIDALYYRFISATEHTWVPRALAAEGAGGEGAGTPSDSTQDNTTPTDPPSPSPESTTEPSPSPTAEPSPTPMPTPTPTPTPTAAPTQTPTPTPTATPTAAPKYDSKAKLKTTKGEQLYIKSGNDYKEATAGDYLSNASQTFYKQSTEATGYNYTGWQTIDNSTYFFDKNGNKVTGEQVIQGAKYTFNGDGVLQAGSGNLGIDVSRFNGSIDWTKVRDSGVSYVIIRCGYRGYTSGGLIEDSKFRENIKGATAAGLKVGVYFVTQAVNEVEAIEEASMTLNMISGYKISYPVFLDVESSGGRGDTIDSGTRTAVINAYCKSIANSGYSSGVYANKTWLTQKFNPGSLGSAKIWLAQYAAAPTYGGRYNMWQYTSKGRINGISGNVDMNLSYLGY